MTCTICGRSRNYHGSEDASPGTYHAESGCYGGVFMDDDVYVEGWHEDADVVYPPCPHNPARCKRCGGSGDAPADVTDWDDCPDCRGTGWEQGNVHSLPLHLPLPVAPFPTSPDIAPILAALRTVRLPTAPRFETALVDDLSAALIRAGIAHRREHVFAAHCRADLWVPPGIVIEVKRRRPPAAALCSQIDRYTSTGIPTAVIIVLERHIDIPSPMHGIPVHILGLNALHGIAL